MSKSLTPPSVGRIVRYVPKEDDPSHNGAPFLPAIIVRTWENTSYENDEVNLKVFSDEHADWWKTSVPHDETGKPGTYYFPTIGK